MEECHFFTALCRPTFFGPFKEGGQKGEEPPNNGYGTQNGADGTHEKERQIPFRFDHAGLIVPNPTWRIRGVWLAFLFVFVNDSRGW